MTLLKALLKHRHMQGHRAFCKEYNNVAATIDPDLKGRHPSKAQFYRWLSGDIIGLPFPDHCRVLEKMFPGRTAEQLFEPYADGIEFVPEPSKPKTTPGSGQATPEPAKLPAELVALYAHRSETPKDLWLDLLNDTREQIDLFAFASLFLPEDNPDAISIIKGKAASGVRVRILLGEPDSAAAELRGREERLFEALSGRIKMAHAYYRSLIAVEGVEFRLHATTLYNSIFRYDDQMLINQHAYGTYGYMAPILHLRRKPGADLFDTYLQSLNLVWDEESYELPAKPSDQPTS